MASVSTTYASAWTWPHLDRALLETIHFSDESSTHSFFLALFSELTQRQCSVPKSSYGGFSLRRAVRIVTGIAGCKAETSVD